MSNSNLNIVDLYLMLAGGIIASLGLLLILITLLLFGTTP